MKFDLYVTDMTGTITPMSEVRRVTEYILDSPDVQAKIAEATGLADIPEVIRKGIDRGNKRDKDHPEFRTYLQVWDKGAEFGYGNGDLTMTLFPDVKVPLQNIRSDNGRIRVFSSGGVEATRLAMKSAGLRELIDACHSSSQPEIGSKVKPAAYIAIARIAGVAPDKMVYVVDAENEADAAVAAKIGRTFLIDRTAKAVAEKEGYFVIPNYGDIVKLTK